MPEHVDIFSTDGPTAQSNDGQPPSAIWTPVRHELRAWFRGTAPSLAPAYEGAVELLGNLAFPGRIHFIAHAVRDISDRLALVLDPHIEGSRVQYEDQLDKIEKQWPQLNDLDLTRNVSASETIAIPWLVAKWIDTLVADHRKRRARPGQSELLFRYLMRNDPSHAEVNQRIVRAFTDMRRWFMALTHLRRDALPVVAEQDLRQRFESFERTLHSFVGSFFTGTRELDAILQQANG